jgi:hypothetical protein
VRFSPHFVLVWPLGFPGGWAIAAMFAATQSTLPLTRAPKTTTKGAASDDEPALIHTQGRAYAMKTITEFSGILLQRAAEAQRAYRAEHPQLATPAAEEAPPAPAMPPKARAGKPRRRGEPRRRPSRRRGQRLCRKQASRDRRGKLRRRAQRGQREVNRGPRRRRAEAAAPDLGTVPRQKPSVLRSRFKATGSAA